MEQATAHGGEAVQNEAFAIEQHGIEPIPDDERRGTARQLFWTWLGAQTNVYCVIFGALLMGLGVSLWEALAIIVFANVTWPLVGLIGSTGARTGTATFAVSRAAFGVRGNLLPTLLNWLTVLGWEAAGLIFGTTAFITLASEIGLPSEFAVKLVCFLLALVLTFGVGVLGHATIVLLERWSARLLGIGSIVVAAYVLPKIGSMHPVASAAAPTQFGTIALGFVLILAGIPFSWLNFPAEYHRYLPRSTSISSQMLWTALGGGLAGIVLTFTGAVAATLSAKVLGDPILGMKAVLPEWLLIVYLLVAVIGLLANNFFSTYTSGMNLLILGVRIPRYKSVLFDAVIAGGVAVYGVFFSNIYDTITEYLSFLILWVSPWAGVFIADLLLRRSRYDAAGLMRGHGGPYWYRHGFSLAGLAAIVLGCVSGLMFANTSIFVGPLVGAIGGGDISAPVALIVGGLGYAAAVRWMPAPAPAAGVAPVTGAASAAEPQLPSPYR